MEQSDVIITIKQLLDNRHDTPIIVAIDGKSAAGKTTLSHVLQEKFDCNVFHMDDFFLQPFQKTDKRLKEIGGNVDYE